MFLTESYNGWIAIKTQPTNQPIKHIHECFHIFIDLFKFHCYSNMWNTNALQKYQLSTALL